MFQPAPIGPATFSGSVTINVVNMSCDSAEHAFYSFLGHGADDLPDGWDMNTKNVTFSKGTRFFSARPVHGGLGGPRRPGPHPRH